MWGSARLDTVWLPSLSYIANHVSTLSIAKVCICFSIWISLMFPVRGCHLKLKSMQSLSWNTSNLIQALSFSSKIIHIHIYWKSRLIWVFFFFYYQQSIIELLDGFFSLLIISARTWHNQCNSISATFTLLRTWKIFNMKYCMNFVFPRSWRTWFITTDWSTLR